MTRDDDVPPADAPPPHDYDAPPPRPDQPWHERLLRNKYGEVKPTYANAYLILANHPDLAGLLAFDEHAYRVYVTRRPPWLCARDVRTFPAVMHEQLDVAPCTEWFQNSYGAAWAKKTIAEAMIDVSWVCRFDAVRDYLESLKWDGIERIADWLVDYAAAENTILNRAISCRWLISAVARILDPGCKADCILVLEGDQGYKKSTAFEVLAGAWFKDEILPMDDQRQAAEMLQGVWIFEIAEFASFKGKANEKIKAFASRRIDRYRPYYGTMSIERPRRTILGSSVNPDQYLTDETGNRRYWPIRVWKRIDIAGLEAARDQLWAEAVHKYRAGTASGRPIPGLWWFEDEELETLAAQAAEERFEVDLWEEHLAPWLEDRLMCTTAEALVQIPGFTREDIKNVTPQIQSRVAKILRRSGLKQTRRDATGKIIPRTWVRRPQRSERRIYARPVRRTRVRQLAFNWRRRPEQYRFRFATEVQ